MVNAPDSRLRDDGIAGALARPLGAGSSLPHAFVLAACLVVGAVAAVTGRHVLVAAALATAVLTGTAAGRRSDHRWSWLAPPLLRAVEHGAVLWAGVVVENAGPAAYAALAALALRHYDLVYRGRSGSHGPAGLETVASWLVGGWQLRTVVVTAAALAGVIEPVLWALAAVVAAVALVDTAASQRGARPVARPLTVAEEEEL